MTHYEHAYRDMVDRVIAKDPAAWNYELNRHLRDMKGGYPPHLVACVSQYQPPRMDRYDAFALAHIVADHREQKLAIGLFDVAGTPRPDREATRNEAILGSLPCGMRATVRSGANFDGDGFLGWDGPVRFMTGERNRVLLVSNGWAPLEIGTTNAARTWLHLQQEAVVARWPYGFGMVGILLNLRKPLAMDVTWTDEELGGYEELTAAGALPDAFVGAYI